MRIPEDFLSNRANQEELDSNHFQFLFRIPYIRAANWFVKNGKANFGRTSPIEGDPKYSGRKKPKWNFHLTSGIFGKT